MLYFSVAVLTTNLRLEMSTFPVTLSDLTSSRHEQLSAPTLRSNRSLTHCRLVVATADPHLQTSYILSALPTFDLDTIVATARPTLEFVQMVAAPWAPYLSICFFFPGLPFYSLKRHPSGLPLASLQRNPCFLQHITYFRLGTPCV